ncbi:MAG: ISNCY family transposase [archaeon]
MKVSTKQIRNVVADIDWIIKVYKKENPASERDWRTYEQQFAFRLKHAMHFFEPLIKEAIQTLKIADNKTLGRKCILSLKQKTILILIKHLIGKSNREMSSMLVLFSLLNDVEVSYKTVERLYSDEAVQLVLHNLHLLILKKKGVEESDSCGDGTGYTLTIKKHYATETQKHKDKVKDAKKLKTASKTKKKKQFVYSFALMDFKTRMYLAFGTSFKSEREAYNKAMEMASKTGIKLKSIRLDKYYSAQQYAKELGTQFKNIILYLIPKKNATIKGPWNWKKTLEQFAKNVMPYLKEYFQRNQSESAFSEDKRRFGWKIQQRKNNTIHTTNFLTTIWHNLFWLG